MAGKRLYGPGSKIVIAFYHNHGGVPEPVRLFHTSLRELLDSTDRRLKESGKRSAKAALKAKPSSKRNASCQDDCPFIRGTLDFKIRTWAKDVEGEVKRTEIELKKRKERRLRTKKAGEGGRPANMIVAREHVERKLYPKLYKRLDERDESAGKSARGIRFLEDTDKRIEREIEERHKETQPERRRH